MALEHNSQSDTDYTLHFQLVMGQFINNNIKKRMGCCMSQQDARSLAVNQPNGQAQQPLPSNHAPARDNRQRQPHNASQVSNGQAANGGGSAGPQIGRITYLQNPNVEKVLSGQASGEGIKKTPAYETPMTKHELDKWRKEFWETRTQGQAHIWQLLRNACEESPETAEALIVAAGLQMPQNSLTLVIDENGVYYRVPISCINEPMNYNVNYQDQKLKAKAKPAEKIYSALKVRGVKGDCTMSISNLVTIVEFKQMYIDKVSAASEGIKVENVRMFCLGKELKDDLFLYTYDIADEMTVQVMIKK